MKLFLTGCAVFVRISTWNDRSGRKRNKVTRQKGNLPQTVRLEGGRTDDLPPMTVENVVHLFFPHHGEFPA